MSRTLIMPTKLRKIYANKIILKIIWFILWCYNKVRGRP